jgi:lysyl oxidase
VKVVALALAALAVAGLHDSTAAAPRELLPDLRQEAPYRIAVQRATVAGRAQYQLVFASAVSNVGLGALVIEGSRGSTSAPAMAARQLVRRADGSTASYAGAGELRYVVSEDHAHWHLLPFERYELRRASGGGAIVRDDKTGFCLGDRYGLPEKVPRAPTDAVYTSNCGRTLTRLLRIREGISVGYGDDYKPSLEGQYLVIDGLATGRYLLVHRVNEERRLRELRVGNNVSSALLQLTITGGVPRVRVLARCVATATCK